MKNFPHICGVGVWRRCQRLLLLPATAILLLLTQLPLPAAAQNTWQERRIEVRTPCADSTLLLPGTLCLPATPKGTVPCVVLVAGSGPQDQDETMGPNKPFGTLAHRLAEAGIASVRYDKRTRVYGLKTWEVSGRRLTYDEEVVDDAAQALLMAAALPEVDARRVFVYGHSLGGMLAPRIALKHDSLARLAGLPPLRGAVMQSAPARPLVTLLREQLNYLGQQNGWTAQTVDTMLRQAEAAMPEEYRAFDAEYAPTQAARQLGRGFRWLVLQGGHDYQVTRTDYDLWQEALKEGKRVRMVWLEKADHLLRDLPKMATPQDYMAAGEMSQEALDIITQWLKGQ